MMKLARMQTSTELVCGLCMVWLFLPIVHLKVTMLFH